MKTRVVHINDNVPGAVYIGRAVPRMGLKRSRWANPHKIDAFTDRSKAVALYRHTLTDRLTASAAGRALVVELQNLAGKPLACWCRHDGEERTPDNACHGDVLCDLIRELGLEGD